jgi:hypothetical protein
MHCEFSILVGLLQKAELANRFSKSGRSVLTIRKARKGKGSCPRKKDSQTPEVRASVEIQEGAGDEETQRDLRTALGAGISGHDPGHNSSRSVRNPHHVLNLRCICWPHGPVSAGCHKAGLSFQVQTIKTDMM